MPKDPSEETIRAMCDKMIDSLGVPAFVVLGVQTSDDPKTGKFTVVYSAAKCPQKAIIKGLLWTLNNLL